MDRDHWNQRYAAEDFVWSVAPNRFLVTEVAGLNPGKALDIAAGEGRNAIWLAEQGWRVTAVDFSEVGLEKGKRRCATQNLNIDWVLTDVTQYRAPAAAYDLVLICYLHLPTVQRQHVLAYAREAVAPGGVLLYIGHDLSNIEHGHGGPQDPAVLCTPQDIAADLPDFEIIKAQLVERSVTIEPGHGTTANTTALDTLVKAARLAAG